MPADQEQRQHQEMKSAGQVDDARAHDAGRVVDPALERRVAPGVGDAACRTCLQQLVDVLAPARSPTVAAPTGVLEDQVPADDPGDQLAHRRVRVGVGAARDRDHRRHLGVAEAGEGAADAGDDERRASPRARRCRRRRRPVSTKMPAPMIAPMPSIDQIERARASASARAGLRRPRADASTDLVANRGLAIAGLASLAQPPSAAWRAQCRPRRRPPTTSPQRSGSSLTISPATITAGVPASVSPSAARRSYRPAARSGPTPPASGTRTSPS